MEGAAEFLTQQTKTFSQQMQTVTLQIHTSEHKTQEGIKLEITSLKQDIKTGLK